MKIAVITGASSGIGKELCYAVQDYIPAVDELWLFARRKNALLDLSKTLYKRTRIFAYDLCEDEGLNAYRSALEEEQAEILFLINAAGFGKLGEVTEIPIEEQLGMLSLNARALTAFTLYSLPYMREKSRIIQMASAAAFLPQREFSVYAASKAYVYSFSLSLREELKKKKIAVTAVCPGPVDTAFFKVAGNEGKLKTIKSLFMQKPKKVAKEALVDSVLNRPLSICGLPMKLFYFLTQIVPDSILLRILDKLYR